MTIAMIVGPASRRPIRALVDPRRAARQSSAALVCDAIWSRVFPTSTCVIGISPTSESPKSGSTTLTTRDYPTPTWPKSALNNEPPTDSGHAENPAPSGCRVRFCAGATSRLRLASRTKCGPGSPGERDAVCSTGYEAGRRRAIGGVAALPATSARPRRWCDAGAPGRQSVTAAQKAGVEAMVRNNGSNRDRGRIHIRKRSNQPASVHHHRRRDAGATSIAAPLAAPTSDGRWNQPASVHTIAGGTPALQASQRPL